MIIKFVFGNLAGISEMPAGFGPGGQRAPRPHLRGEKT